VPASSSNPPTSRLTTRSSSPSFHLPNAPPKPCRNTPGSPSPSAPRHSEAALATWEADLTGEGLARVTDLQPTLPGVEVFCPTLGAFLKLRYTELFE